MSQYTIRLGAVIFLVAVLPLHSDARRRKKKELEPITWADITDTDWNVTLDSTDRDNGAVMIFDRIRDDDSRLWKDSICQCQIYRRLRILASDGRTYADIDVPRLDSDERVLDIQGRTVLRDGQVIELKPENIFTKDVVKTKQGKIRQKAFSIPGVTDDCIIEYVIRYELPNHSGVWFVQRDLRLLSGEYHWTLPPAEDLKNRGATLETWSDGLFMYYSVGFQGPIFTTPNWVWQNSAFEYDFELLGSPQNPEGLIFKAENVLPHVDEAFDRPVAAVRGRLLCFYTTPGSSYEYWSDMGMLEWRWVNRFCDESERVKEVLEKFHGLGSNQEKVDSVYNWIQHNITPMTWYDYAENAELSEFKRNTRHKVDKLKINKDADEVLERGYGLAEQVDYILAYLLGELGVKSALAAVVDKDEGLFDKEVKAWQFDRNLVAAKLGDYNIKFYTTGIPYLPAGTTPWFTEGCEALMLDGSGRTITVPYSEADFSTTECTYKYALTPALDITGTSTISRMGHDAWTTRMNLDDTLEQEALEVAKKLVEGMYSEVEIDSVVVDNPEEPNKPVILSFALRHPTAASLGERLMLKPFAYFCDLPDNPFTADERRGDIVFDYAHTLHEKALITLPPDWEVEALPADTSFSNRVGSCVLSFSQENHVLECQRQWVLDFPYWRPEDYSEVKSLFEMRQNLSDRVVVLKKSMATGSVD